MPSCHVLKVCEVKADRRIADSRRLALTRDAGAVAVAPFGVAVAAVIGKLSDKISPQQLCEDQKNSLSRE